jgi:drug/metabolite transporter (DMT)-like permease
MTAAAEQAAGQGAPSDRARRRGAACGLLAAALFGASAPVAKLLLPAGSAVMLAAWLYLGAGLCLLAFRGLRALRGGAAGAEAALRRSDLGTLVAITLLGGACGPVLMLLGLARTSGLVASLLLNLEAPLTMGLAVLLFGEHLSRREALAGLGIIAGAVLLALRPGDAAAGAAQETTTLGRSLGALALLGACACWALDNNLTQRLSLRDPVALVQWKTLGAGVCNLGLALLLGHALPAPRALVAVLALGALSYGVSVLLDAYALRLLGAAREAALFATAPFVGAALAVPLLGERPSLRDGLAAGVLIGGVALLLRARHAHLHAHEAMEHDHAHVHDEHHRHAHPPGSEPARPDAPHAHPHRHAPLLHDHPHVADLHHRHRH